MKKTDQYIPLTIVASDAYRYSVQFLIFYIVDDDSKQRTSILDSIDDIDSIILKTLGTHISSIKRHQYILLIHARHTIVCQLHKILPSTCGPPSPILGPTLKSSQISLISSVPIRMTVLHLSVSVNARRYWQLWFFWSYLTIGLKPRSPDDEWKFSCRRDHKLCCIQEEALAGHQNSFRDDGRSSNQSSRRKISASYSIAVS